MTKCGAIIATYVPSTHKQSRRKTTNANVLYLTSRGCSTIQLRLIYADHPFQTACALRPSVLSHHCPPKPALVCSLAIFVSHSGIITCIYLYFLLIFADYERLRSELSEIVNRASHPPEAEAESTTYNNVNCSDSAPTKAMVSAELTRC